MIGYPKYVCCEGDWITEIPSSWNIVRGKFLFDIKKRIAGEIGHAVLSITQTGIKEKDTESGDGQLSMDYSKYQLVEPGDFAMNHMDLLTGYVDISRFHGVTSPDYRVFSSRRSESVDRYYLYVLQMGYTNRIFYKYGQGASHLGRWRLPTDGFNNFWFPRPPADEQNKIADFLDHETAKMDTLIEKQQQLIELLKEKRQAVISHAVTKGLNADAPMRDSGVEWLGEVPAHWDVVPLMSVADVVDPNPSHRNPVYTDEGFPFISTVEFIGIDDVEINTPRKVAEITVHEQEQRCGFTNGSIAFSRKGTIGEVRVLPFDTRFALLDSVCVINCGKKLDYRFLYQQARSSLFESQLGALTRGAALKQVSVGRVRNVRVFLPPMEEQYKIVGYLNEQLSGLDRASSQAMKQISLLQERRSALISAAVTGEIDVRDWQPPESPAKEAA